MNTLILYYSYGGNTKRIAEMIQKRIGGWIGHTFRDFEKECKGADVRKGLNVKFDEATLRTSEKEIETWISGVENAAK